MTKDEALKLALDALEEITLAGMSGSGQESEEAMTAWHARQAWKFIGIAARALDPIKQALTAPVQEPDRGDELTIAYMSGLHDGKKKRQWVGLTDEEMQALWDRYAHMEMMRAIEAKLKERNI
jgi:hypothetical protein